MNTSPPPTPPKISTSLNRLLNIISFSTPIIIPLSIILVTTFSGISLNGLVYVVSILVFTIIRGGIYNYVINTPNSPKPSTICQEYEYIPTSNITLSIFVLSFTFMYICFPMFLSNSINIGILSLLIIYYIFDVFIKLQLKCLGEDYMLMIKDILGNTIIGSGCGVLMVYFFKLIKAPQILILTDSRTNKVTCGLPSKQKFKCSVYQNGKLVSQHIK